MKNAEIHAYLLRRPQIDCGERTFSVRLKKAQALLYYLLLQKKATRSELIGLLWSDEEETLAYRHLRDNLYHLKKILPMELIVPMGRSAIQLNPDYTFIVDVEEFLSSSDPKAYQESFLPGFAVPNCYEYEAWLERMRTSLREEYLRRLDQRAEMLCSAGCEEEAESCWQRYLQEEPLSETVSLKLMELYHARRDYHRASRVYRALHQAMSDLLGIAPLKETSERYYAMMKEWNERAEDELEDDVLIGRQEQLQSMLRLFSRGRREHTCPSFVIMGEAGVGKTYLLSYFLSHGGAPDVQCIRATCFKSKREEYLYPWQAIMLSLASYMEKENISVSNGCRQAVSALFPVFAGKAGSEVEQHAHILLDSVMSFDNVLKLLSFAAAKQTLLLVIEDIQWIDEVSLALLDQAMRKITPGSILLAATCRQPEGEIVSAFLRSAEEDGLCRRYELAPFTREETMQYIDLCGARDMGQGDKDSIYRDTQGNAFLLTQLIGSIMENGRPRAMPCNLEAILSYRLSGLNAEGKQILNLVAMFPDYASYSVLEQVSSRAPLDLLYICQELCRRSILAEVYDGGNLSLVFTQAEFRELTYSRIPVLSRRVLHLNIAQVLSGLRDERAIPNLDALTAYHYEQGGDELHAFRYKVKRFKAYVFCNYALLNGSPRGGETLLDSTPQAMQLFRQMEQELHTLKRQYPNDAAIRDAEMDFYYSMSCFCIYRGLYELGVEAATRLLEDAKTPENLLDLAHEQMIFYGIQTYQTDVMRTHIACALRLTEGVAPARYAINRRYLGYLLVMEGRFEEGRAELTRAIGLLREAVTDDVEKRLQIAYAHDYIGEAYRREGYFAQAIGEYRIAAEMIRDHPTSTSKPMFYVDWAMAAMAQGDFDAARESLRRSDQAAENVKEPSGYFRTLFCACDALIAFADGAYQRCAEELELCEKLTRQLVVPYDTGVMYLIMALIRCYCEAQQIEAPELKRALTETVGTYCRMSREKMSRKDGIFERTLLQRLEHGCEDPLPGLFR